MTRIGTDDFPAGLDHTVARLTLAQPSPVSTRAFAASRCARVNACGSYSGLGALLMLVLRREVGDGGTDGASGALGFMVGPAAQEGLTAGAGCAIVLVGTVGGWARE
ncbi:hypothetical protein GCM10010330_66560 [Streptomyces tendae]|uniref:hypothetical protein n=1 Tax=Streptomyces tendae TaxID=1932 RepID=UPI001674F8EC|nr:hypothetical protein [Streptomyces tendae]GHB03025.1 hypothetical protein GCM10010330_66560 [Streptomyces tendae]